MEKPNVPSSTAEMLEAIRAEKRILRQRLAKLDEREKVVEGWMAEEKAQQQELPLDQSRIIPRRKVTSLIGFLRESIADGHPRSNAELAALAVAQGLVPEHVDLRSIHSVMMGLQNAGLVERDDGRWVKQG